METIISYIDNLFRNYPDTPQVRRAREELLGIMEDKYHELKAEGKSENEAIGVVISEFGSMDEIAFELDLDKEPNTKQDFTKDARPQKHLTLEQAQDYIRSQKLFGIKIAAGVALCICSPIGPCIMDSVHQLGLIPEAIAEAAGASGLFLMVAAAVGIFITAGMANRRYEDYKKCGITLDFQAKKYLTEQYEAFSQNFGTRIAVGVILCIISVIPSICMEAVFESRRFEWLRNLTGLTLLLFVAAGVVLFITEGMQKNAYEIMLGKGEFAPERIIKKKGNKLTEVMAAIFWPLVTACYLVWSFTTQDWGFTWIIWPASGLIFGAISAAIAIIYRQD